MEPTLLTYLGFISQLGLPQNDVTFNLYLNYKSMYVYLMDNSEPEWITGVTHIGSTNPAED